jgi:hypothetical protein
MPALDACPPDPDSISPAQSSWSTIGLRVLLNSVLSLLEAPPITFSLQGTCPALGTLQWVRQVGLFGGCSQGLAVHLGENSGHRVPQNGCSPWLQGLVGGTCPREGAGIICFLS